MQYICCSTHPKSTEVQDPSRVQKAVFKDGKPPAAAAVHKLVDEKRFSNLRRLVGTIAWTWRTAKKFLQGKTANKAKWEAVPPSGAITVNERDVVFRDSCLAPQEVENFPNTTIDRLVAYKDPSSGLLMCGGRIQTFSEDCKGVPLLSFHAWISSLPAREAHNEGHDGVAGTLLWMRRKAWIIKGIIIAQKVVDKCIVC